ncbi:probable phosphoglycerate mutase [Micromonospora haikouensis]|uniref:Probable phosphoglycerate mutase n=1 Tax=Micromonospora haikouensis TaxID=686309 RepID=A0A1C4XDH1_9ACTN|nr:histidine phosphatase family protein [Micromonospora haikouensis]SCF06506.1 probable phosphoglycerate mutase [Micromonospora haikouensis]
MPADQRAEPDGRGCRLILIRHGQTPCTLAGRFCGSHDSALTPVGEQMAEAIGNHPALHGIEAVVSSPAQRARHTARMIAEKHGQRVVVDDRLRELHFGTWENLLPSDVPVPAEHERWELDPAYFSPPDGESGLDVLARAVAAVRDAMHGRSAVAVVTHKAPVRLVLAFFLGIPPSRYRDIAGVSVASVSWLTVRPTGSTLHRLGDVSHLPQPWRANPDTARIDEDALQLR